MCLELFLSGQTFLQLCGISEQTALDLPDLALQGALGVNSSMVTLRSSDKLHKSSA